MKFLTQVLEKHKLTLDEKKAIYGEIDIVIEMIDKALKKSKVNARPVLGGSAAKGTFLKGDFDVDLFVKFNYKYKEENLSDILEKVLKKFKPNRVQGSRDYFQFTHKKINYEVVPVLSVNSYKKAINVTDASPLHVDWVKKRVKNSKLRDEIILTKVFLKANKLYGAESYIKGFSGHVVDILTIHHGGFLKLLRATQRWKHGEVIDPEKHKTFRDLNRSKMGALVIIDPVQPDRNASAALSAVNFNRLKAVAKEFLQEPSSAFFEREEITIAKLKKKAGENKLIVLKVNALKGKQDVVGAKLLKAYTHILRGLKKHDFIIIEKDWEWDKPHKAMFWFIVDSEIMPKFKEHPGPPLTSKEHVKIFEKTYKDTYVKNKRIFAKVQRKYRKPELLISKLIKDEYVEERVKKIEN